MSNKNTILLIASLIVLVVAGAIIFITLKPSPQLQVTQPPVETLPKEEEIDTSTWQTYRSEEYGFEVRYPGFPVIILEEWLKFTRPGRDIEEINIYAGYDAETGLYTGNGRITIYPFKENVLVDSWVKERINDWYYQWGEISEGKDDYSLEAIYPIDDDVKVLKLYSINKEKPIGLLLPVISRREDFSLPEIYLSLPEKGYFTHYHVIYVDSDHYFIQPNSKTIIHFYIDVEDLTQFGITPKLVEEILSTFKFIK